MFDRYLLAQARPTGSGARRAILIASIGVHALVAAALVAWSLRQVEKRPPTPTPVVTFFGGPPSSSAPQAGGGGAAATVKAQAPHPRAVPPARPARAKQLEPDAIAPAPSPSAPLAGDEGPASAVGPAANGGGAGPGLGVGSGAGSGVESGVLGGGGAFGSLPPRPPSRPKNVAHEPRLDDYLERPLPHVPDAIKSERKGTEGAFVAKMCFDPSGAVLNVTVLSGIPGADEVITQTLRRWRLKPLPIPMCFPVRLLFTFE